MILLNIRITITLTNMLTSSQNIAKAKAEIEKLENESASTEKKEGSTDIAKKPAQKNNAVDDNNGVSAEAELKQEKEATEDVTEEMKKASIEESQ